jgi:hypothetical protein
MADQRIVFCDSIKRTPAAIVKYRYAVSATKASVLQSRPSLKSVIVSLVYRGVLGYFAQRFYLYF